ncbi:RHS repeat-associated core domain-containing protein [Lysobacter antibioticus]|uniref:RHS repeat-associated core domain protein n=1 Tax=Lysobacter antibioticus TaxID=84531 RepID=A0A0S2F7N4_LYSAN|nr:RHS repeat-associated core domain-containing protein [Lysobacter antibioticus]ALN79551.1 RHS repeat-associated core domain protein [Lysobacter antibioticus]
MKWISKLIATALFAVAAFTVQAQTVVEYIHTDALGSPVAVTDANQNVVERSEYEPYGRLLNRPLTDGPGYTGHIGDAATGLTYMQQRYYDTEIGRFLSIDPVSVDTNTAALFNRYMYAAANPYRYVDPDGRCTGSRMTNDDGTCRSTGGATTQSYRLSSPSSMVQERTDNAATGAIGRAASAEANSALAKAGVASSTYSSKGRAARAWANVVQKVANKYNTEIASRLFAAPNEKIVTGSATSDGFITEVNPDFSESPNSLYVTVGYIHTHPRNSLFSGNDLNYVLGMYRAVNGWGRNTSGAIDQTAFVSRPDGKVYGWDASSYINSGGASYMQESSYVEY